MDKVNKSLYRDMSIGWVGVRDSNGMQKNYKYKEKVEKLDVGVNFSSINDFIVCNINKNGNDRERYKTRIIWNYRYKKKYLNNKDIYDWNDDRNIHRDKIKNNKLRYKQEHIRLLKYRKCGNAKCKACPMLSDDSVDEDNNFVFCKTFNCIYLMKCKICGMKYVGQTSNKINIRLNQHRHDIKIMNKKHLDNELNRLEIRHFKKHGIENIEIGIIKIEPNNKKRLWYENYLMKKLDTVYPYGLNLLYYNRYMPNIIKDIKENYIYESKNNKVKYDRDNFTKDKILNRISRGSGERKKKGIVKEDIDILKDIESLNKEFSNKYNFAKIKKYVFGLNNREHIKLRRLLFTKNNENNKHIDDLIRDYNKYICKMRNIEVDIFKIQKDRQKEYCVFLYMNKTYNNINFGKILNNNMDLFPIKNIYIARAFKYNKTIGRMIYNYKYYNNTDSETNCICDKYNNYIDINHGHIITGNMDIVKDVIGNEKLKNIMNNGTKYRLVISNKNHIINKQIKIDIDTFIYKVSIKYNMPIEAFNEWRFNILKNFKQNNFKHDPYIKYRDIKEDIINLQKNFIITYIDKANNNFAIICKKYYNEVLINFLNNNDCYTEINNSIREINNRIIAKHKLIDFNIGNIRYPYIFLTPKLHKDPISFRTVTSGFNTYINIAGKKLQHIIQHIIHNLKDSIIINNSYDVVNYINRLENIPSSIYTYDFKDLFNNIEIDDLIKVLEWLYIDFNLIDIICKDKYNNLIQLVIKENYVYMFNKLYRQHKGIPQGAPCSNSLANIFLYYYERNNNNSNSQTFRYIDDLIVFNFTDNYFPSFDYYPAYLQLLLTNNIKIKADFLDLTINLRNSDVNFSLYDKTNNYNFQINKLQHFTSNISIEIFRNILINYNNRIEKNNSSDYDKNNNRNILLNKAIKSDYPIDFIYTYLYNNKNRNGYTARKNQ